MVKYLLLLVLLCSAWYSSIAVHQTSIKWNALVSVNSDTLGYGGFAQPTENRDTLYLLKNNEPAKLAFAIWKNDPLWSGKNPVIIFVSTKKMVVIKESYALLTLNARITPIRKNNE